MRKNPRWPCSDIASCAHNQHNTKRRFLICLASGVYGTHSFADIHVTAVLDRDLALIAGELRGSRGQGRDARLVHDEALLDARPSTQPTDVDAQEDNNNGEHARETGQQGHEDRAVEGIVTEDFLDRLVQLGTPVNSRWRI